MCTLVSLIILHSLEQKSLGYRCNAFSFSHSCQQPKCRTMHSSSQEHLLHGAVGSQHGVGGEKFPPITIYPGPKLKPVLLMRTGDKFRHPKKVGSQREEKKTPCISMQVACRELLQKQCCYVDQIFPVLSIQFFQTEGDSLLNRGFSQSLSISKPHIELESLCTLSRDQQALYPACSLVYTYSLGISEPRSHNYNYMFVMLCFCIRVTKSRRTPIQGHVHQ